MDQLNLINQSTAIIITLGISLLFIVIGISYSKKHQGLNNYLLANRSVGVFSLTSSLVASALGAWILFGPASAATWGGIGAVIGYALGTAFPLFIRSFSGFLRSQVLIFLLNNDGLGLDDEVISIE